jgi:hypothetical protein
VRLWGVQLEIGSVATPLEKPDPQQDLAKCQRFFEVTAGRLIGYGTAALLFGQSFSYATPKRATPTLAIAPGGAGTASNATGFNMDSTSVNAFRAYATVTATGNAFWNDFTMWSSADL